MIHSINTKDYFQLFREECELWIDRLSLHDWRIYLTNEGHNDGALATTCLDINQQSAAINLEQTWQIYSEESIENSIQMAAFHEVMHVFLASLIEISKTRSYDSDLIEKHEHAIISVLYPMVSEQKSIIPIENTENL